MTMTRKMFCKAAFGSIGSTALLLLLPSCGGGGDSSSGMPSPPPVSMGCGDAAISGNHGHLLAIPTADLSSTTDKTYDIKGSSAHSHSITLTAANLADLKAGRTVNNVVSTVGDAHTHTLTVSMSCVV